MKKKFLLLVLTCVVCSFYATAQVPPSKQCEKCGKIIDTKRVVNDRCQHNGKHPRCEDCKKIIDKGHVIENRCKYDGDHPPYTIEFVCNVSSAILYVDDQYQGPLDQKHRLKSGKHIIKVTADGYKEETEEIVVNYTSRKRYFINLLSWYQVAKQEYNQGYYEKALPWMQKAAEKGDKYAQYYFGVMYQYGRGVPRNDTTAVFWYRKAAQQGLADAQINLGYMYSEGFGTQRNDSSVIYWFHKAEQQGEPYACRNIGNHYRYGRSLQKRWDSASVMYFEAAYLFYKDYNYEQAYKTLTEYLLPLLKENEKTVAKGWYAICLGNASYYAIFEKKYSEAEQFARQGIQKDSSKHWIQTNLAAALLFQGKYTEAERIYRQYKDELKTSFLDDFNRFSKAGAIPQQYESDVLKIKELLYEGDGVTSLLTTATAKSFTVNGVTFTMIPVEGGTFTMGTASQYSDHSPAHEVTVSDFYIGETEVTQALWKAVMGSNPSFFKGDSLPVENVSWYDCQEFVRRLSDILGDDLPKQRFRLPTEAEWEYAARGGRKSQGYMYAGSKNLEEVAWYYANSGDKHITTSDRTYAVVRENNCRTHPVKLKKANELGLYDMSGNVLEWCEDYYHRYGNSSQNDPKETTWSLKRILRGGCWDFGFCDCWVKDRHHSFPYVYHFDKGLRLVLD